MRSRLFQLLILAICLGWMAPAAAQELTPERVQLEIARTDERIEQAEIVVSESGNDLAERELASAISMQSSAKVSLQAGRLRMALDLTLGARSRALRAMSIVRGLPDPDRVLAQIERTREIIERSRDRIEECNDVRARGMLKAAMGMQGRAESSFHSDRFLAALQLTTSARERALRALRTCKLQENFQESAERALRRTDEVIGRARDRLGDSESEPGRRALARAAEMQERAYGEYRSQHFEASLRFTQTARALAYRALRQSGGGS